MADFTTNLASPLGAPMIVLAPASEFLVITGGADDGMPTAHKQRMGTNWVGLNGTFGTITKAALKHLGDKKEQPAVSPGTVRSATWTKLGYSLSLTVHHDRGLPALRKGDLIEAWVETGKTAAAEKLTFHIEEISADKGDEDTATLDLEVMHTKFLTDSTSLIRAEVDGMGRVINSTTTKKATAAGTDPALGLPTAHG